MLDEITVDVLVAGGGVGGLMAAYSAQQCGANVMLLGASAGASNRISVMNTALEYDERDTPPALFDDMFKAGGYLNNSNLLANVTSRVGPETTQLASLGVPFVRQDGRFARRQAAGSSFPRGVYTLGMVGVDISQQLRSAMLSAPRAVNILDGAIVVDLYTNDGAVSGALVYDSKKMRWLGVRAGAVVLATGGAGQLFSRTTNPRGSAGTGYALALEAGCELVDMEFVSFEPFITWAPGTKGHDLPTTVLKEGAKVRNGLGEEFIDASASPAKDVICRAMVNEVREGRGTPSGAVYYDLRGMEPSAIERYPQIQQALKALRNKSGDRPLELEVMPAQHYLMGGIKIDQYGAAKVAGLFAVGEVAGGTHGAHRLAGAGGTEVVALGAIVGEQSASFAKQRRDRPELPVAQPRPQLLGANLSPRAKGLLDQIRVAMDGCGILRNASELSQAVKALTDILDESRADADLAYVARAALVALVVATGSWRRQESRGDHFREDFPVRNDVLWLGNFVATLEEPYRPVVRYVSAQEGASQQRAPMDFQ